MNDIVDTFLNMVAFSFLIGLLYLYLKPETKD